MTGPAENTRSMGMFTPLDLEQVLVRQVTIWTQDMLFKSPVDRGAALVPLQVTAGYIDSYQAGPTAIQQQPKAPSVAIRCVGGFYRRLDGVAHVNMSIITFDDNLGRIGYQDVQNIINRIAYGLLEGAAAIGNSFILLQDSVNEESIIYDLIEDPSVDFFPYWLGMLSAKFGIMSPGPNSAPYGDTGPDTGTLIGPSQGSINPPPWFTDPPSPSIPAPDPDL